MYISRSDISMIDTDYFSIVEATPFYIVLESKNTGHSWHLLHTEANGHVSYRISHRHHTQDPFHPQTSAPGISAACDYIKRHDAFHLLRQKKKAEKRLKRLSGLQGQP